MRLARFTKASTERKRYTIDYADWLDTGETLASADFTVTPAGDNALRVDASSIATPATSVVYFANYGSDGVTYTVDVTITTSGGQIKEDQVLYSVKDQ